ncbi:MAG TPA: hypothetical protein VK171_08565 [Fimbriimonas sp.]|nr:hypothetical protein [Fimbriimonas sp.]
MNSQLMSWLVSTTIIVVFVAPFAYWHGPMVAVFAFMSIAQYGYESIKKSRKNKEIVRVELPDDKVPQVVHQLRSLGVKNMRVQVEQSTEFAAPYAGYGLIAIPSCAVENWPEVTLNWSIRRAVLQTRVFGKLFLSIVLGGLVASILLYSFRPFGWEPFVYGLIITVVMVAVLVPLMIRLENAGDRLASQGVSPEEALEYFRYLASDALTRYSNEQATKEIARLQERASRIGLTERLV